MCGIVGIFDLSNQLINTGLLKRMTDIIKHRGPDDEGFYFNENIGLGHRRLSIIDLSSAGHQPMSNEDETIWLIYNGEVYNYLELKKELSDKGYKFRTSTDTEVIIKSYEEWGEACLNRFNGMFAFALWDNRRKKLFCARDRFGIKPFYYYFDGKTFIFASEIKSILLHPSVPKRPNEPIIYDYLSRNSVDHTNETFFEHVMHLPPAHYITLDIKGKLLIDRWYSINMNDDLGDFSGKKDKEYAEEFLQIFTNAIKLHLRSDVPIGSCLSGGLDSSSIVCLVNKLVFNNGDIDKAIVSERQKTFTASYEDERIDEKKYAEDIVKLTGADGNYIFPDGDMLWQELDKLIWHQEEPFASTSIYAQWCVIRKAFSKNIKVLLDGQGGDELLAGYYGWYVPAWGKTLLKKWHPIRMLKETSAFSDIMKINSKDIIKTALYDLMPKDITNILKLLLQRQKIRPPFINESLYKNYNNRIFGVPTYCNLDEYLHKTTIDYNLKALLRYEDKNSSAFSIEARVPFLDSKLVEFIFGLPLNQKIRNGWTKFVLRNAMKGIIPESIRLRRSKLGFDTPEYSWLEQNRGKIRDIFASQNFLSKNYLSREWIISYLDNISETNIENTAIWRWINLESWMRIWNL